MAVLSVKVRIAEKGMVKTMQFDPSTVVYDACKIIREKMPEANLGQPKDYGLFLADDDPKKGVWMDNGRPLEYYLVRTGDLLEYKKKIRTLRVRMLDGTVKTLLVDDSQPLGQLMVVICTRIGITNHDEYSLIRENALDDKERISMQRKEDKGGTLTLGRSKEKKMEQLRKQLHTDEELNWLDHGKTLREQGVEESETLLLRRKYFFSDQNIDSRDPVQLNLLFVQCRDGVLEGAHPVSVEEAFQLAGLQCQTQFGDFVETKHRSGFLDLKEFLPKEYLKIKGAEKRVLQEYRNRRGWNENDAKVEYIRRCRSLKTYGVTFFLVKEKMKGKNKLVPRLLGVNKDSVIRVDERTKEVLKVWPLEQVRRWAASPNTFTLDFGDYQDQYYSVQTNDGEKIAQLIAGYIDILLKRRKAKDHFGVEGDEGSTMLEDTVAPAKATLMSRGELAALQGEEGNVALPGVMRAGINGEMQYGTGSMPKAQYGAVGGVVIGQHPPVAGQQPKVFDTMSRAQRALVGTIKTSIRTIEKAEEDLQTKAPLPHLGDDLASRKWKENERDVSKQKVQDQLAAIGAATAEVVQKTGAIPDRVDHTAVGAAISTISSNIPDMTKGVRTVAALMDEEDRGDRLLDAARRLCKAFSDLLRSVNPETQDRASDIGETAAGPSVVAPVQQQVPLRRSSLLHTDIETRQNFLAAAGRVGDYSKSMIETMEEPTDAEKEFQDLLIQLAKAVATTTAKLVLEAKAVSGHCENQALQEHVVHSATECAFATSQLVACTRVVAPTIDSPACQDQLTDAARQVAKAVERLLKDAEFACKDERSLGNLRDAATRVSKNLNDLLSHIKTGPRRPQYSDVHVDTIMQSTQRIISVHDDQKDVISNARLVAEATGSLITHMKSEAETDGDQHHRQRLMGAAKKLADATTRMIEAAKSCASSPLDFDNQLQLRSAAEEVRDATSYAAHDQLRRVPLLKLEQAVKQAVANATQSVAAAAVCEPTNKNPQSQQEMTYRCQEVADLTPRVIAAVKSYRLRPDESSAQLDLIRAAQEFIQPCENLVRVGKAAVPTITNEAASLQLSNATKNLSQSLVELRMSISRAQETSDRAGELDNAIRIVKQLDGELADLRLSLSEDRLYPLPGETSEVCASQLHSSSKAIGSSMSQLLSAAAQGDEAYVGVLARDTVDGLHCLTSAVHGIAATTPEAPREKLIDCGRDVMDKSGNLLMEVKYCVEHPGHPDNQQRLAQVAKAVTFSLNSTVNCIPGQQDIDTGINAITAAVQNISIHNPSASPRPYASVQDDLLRAASDLSEATNRVVCAVGGPRHVLAESVNHYVHVFKYFVPIVSELAYHIQDPALHDQIIELLKAIAQQSGRFLLNIKSFAADPHAANSKAQITSSARSVTESINRLVDICTAGAPWQKECDNALRRIQACRPFLENPVEPINDSSYFECLDAVTEKSKSLGEGVTGIAHHAKNSELDYFCQSVREVSDAVCGLAECAGQSAYLVGTADQNSIAGRLGLVDTGQFNRSVEAVRESCEQVKSPNMQQVLEATSVIAKHTAVLANICREASARTSHPSAKKHFINCARDLASSTANLIKAIKVLDSDFTDANRQMCSEATVPLTNAVDTLVAFASSPEFATVPAKISPEGKKSQEPITLAGRRMLDGSCDMILTAKSLAVNPKDPPTWQLLATHSKVVSDSIKNLVSAIRDRAPGLNECDWAVGRLNDHIRQLDQSSMSVISQNLPARTDGTEQIFQEQLNNSSQQIIERVDLMRIAAIREAENLGHRVREIMSYFDPLVDSAIAAASLSQNSKQQMAYLDQVKTVCECMLQFTYSAKDCGGNPKVTHFHEELNSQAGNVHQALEELVQTVSKAVSESGTVSTMLDEITRAIAKTDEEMNIGDASFVDYQTRMVNALREISRIAQEMVAKSYTNVGDLGPLALELSKNYSQLAEDSRGAVAAIAGSEVAHRIRSSVQDLGSACIDLVKNAGTVRSNPSDAFSKRELSDAARTVAERVSAVLAALQAGSRGTQACISAASTVSGIIGDLDTTIMFATAGTLNPERDGDVFSDHREAILKTAKALVEDTKALVAGAASSQEQLAVAAQNAVRTIIQLSDVVKSGAAALTNTNSEAQVLVINAVKDVAAALQNLIIATKQASGKNFDTPEMAYLKEAAKLMVSNVTSMLKTVKTVEDEHQRGTRALEATIEAIAQEIRAYDSGDQPVRPANPEELIRVTKPITDSTAKAVAAGQSCQQEDVIIAANSARKVVYDLLTACKSCAVKAETPEAKYKTLDAGRDVAIKVRELLQTLHMVLQKPTQEARSMLVPASRNIAQAVTELIGYADILKGADWIDPSDPTVLAENELFGAASSIEAAAKKLSMLRPRERPPEADEMLNFDEQILEAAKSIAAAVTALVKAASAAQRELVAQGRVEARPRLQTDDYQWSEGLVSAARMVAAATHSLCESANALVQGLATEERLISAAKQVASSTAQLLVACKVKADINSRTMQRLQVAGNAVKTATEHLVRAAKQAIEAEDERTLKISQRMVSGIAQVMEAQEEVIRKERELEEARVKLSAVRKAKYTDRTESGGSHEGSPAAYCSDF